MESREAPRNLERWQNGQEGLREATGGRKASLETLPRPASERVGGIRQSSKVAGQIGAHRSEAGQMLLGDGDYSANQWWSWAPLVNNPNPDFHWSVFHIRQVLSPPSASMSAYGQWLALYV